MCCCVCVSQMMLSSHEATPAHTTDCFFDSGAADALAAALQVIFGLMLPLSKADNRPQLLAGCALGAAAEQSPLLPCPPLANSALHGPMSAMQARARRS